MLFYYLIILSFSPVYWVYPYTAVWKMDYLLFLVQYVRTPLARHMGQLDYKFLFIMY